MADMGALINVMAGESEFEVGPRAHAPRWRILS